MLFWPVISIGGVRDLFESRINGEGQMLPQVLVDPSDVFERGGDAARAPTGLGSAGRAMLACDSEAGPLGRARAEEVR